MNDLERVALVNHGHFTSIAVFPGGVRGLTRHLERLDRDAKIVFGHGIDGEAVRRRLHEAIQGHDLPANVRVTVFTPDTAFDHMYELGQPDFLIKVRPMRRQGRPRRVRSSVHSRYLPEVKHVGTFSLFHEVRLAQLAGFDDVLFTDEQGRVSEGSVWNVGFHDGEKFVWPDSPALPGVEMTLLREGFRALGIPDERREVRLAELGTFRSAFTTNAIGGPVPIASVDDVVYEPDPRVAELLEAARQAVPLEPLTP